MLASARPYTHFCNFHTWLVLASFRGLTYTVRSIALPCKNAVLTSNEFNVHLLDAIIEQVKWSPSLEHVALSVLKFCSSLNPLAHNIALIHFSLSTNFSLITHLREMQSWFWSGVFWYTFSLFHWWSSFSFPSSIFFFILSYQSFMGLCLSSSSDRFDNSSIISISWFALLLVSDGVGVSSNIFHSAVLVKSISCLKLLWLLVLQQFEYFPVPLPAHDSTFTVYHALFSLSLYSVVIVSFILVGTVVSWYLLCRFFSCFDGTVLLLWKSSSSLRSSSLLLVSFWGDESVCSLKLVGQWINFAFCGLGASMVVSVSGVGRGEDGINWSLQGCTLT